VTHARTALGTAFLGLALGAGADEIKGTFQFGTIRFTPTDALAYQAEGQEPGQTVTVVILADFKIDRSLAMAAIDTAGGIMGQIFTQQSGNAVFVTLATKGKCGVSGFFEGSRSVGLGEGFTATTKAATASRVAGSCATDTPGKMFDDAYEFRLSYDVPVTAIPKPTALGAGGGEPGAAYLALVKAIQAADYPTASRYLPDHQLPAKAPAAAEAKDYFHGLALNYPKSAKVTGALVKGDLARVDVEGVHDEGRKIKGPVSMKKTEGAWRVLEQGFSFTE
jgi:hypothetical protein